jgi:hypothetical protein
MAWSAWLGDRRKVSAYFAPEGGYTEILLLTTVKMLWAICWDDNLKVTG